MILAVLGRHAVAHQKDRRWSKSNPLLVLRISLLVHQSLALAGLGCAVSAVVASRALAANHAAFLAVIRAVFPAAALADLFFDDK